MAHQNANQNPNLNQNKISGSEIQMLIKTILEYNNENLYAFITQIDRIIEHLQPMTKLYNLFLSLK